MLLLLNGNHTFANWHRTWTVAFSGYRQSVLSVAA